MFVLIVVVSLATGERNHDVAVAFQLLGNAACIGSGIWLITRALRESLTHYFYMGIGNEIGYDSANGFSKGIPVSRKPFYGSSGRRTEQIQSLSQRTIRGSRLWRPDG